MGSYVLTRFEAVLGTAIGAFGLTSTRHIQKHFGMAVPQLHVGQGAGAKHAAVAVELFGQQLDGFHVKPWSANARTWGYGH